MMTIVVIIHISKHFAERVEELVLLIAAQVIATCLLDLLKM